MNTKYSCGNCGFIAVGESSEFCARCGSRMVSSTEIASPFASIIAKAAKTQSSGPLAEARSIIDKQKAQAANRIKNASAITVVLADCSISMDTPIGTLQRTKHEHLRIALTDVLKFYPKTKLVAFNNRIKEVSGLADLPEPAGDTDLAGAITYAKRFRPRRTVIISDGQPNDANAALQAADSITGVINAIYCGPESDSQAIAFLQSLTVKYFGTYTVFDGNYKELGVTIRGLLE